MEYGKIQLIHEKADAPYYVKVGAGENRYYEREYVERPDAVLDYQIIRRSIRDLGNHPAIAVQNLSFRYCES